MIGRAIVLIAALSLLAIFASILFEAAHAQLLTTGVGTAASSAGGCSNSLVFSSACNSQYLTLGTP